MGGSVSVESQVGMGTDFIINVKTKSKPCKYELKPPELILQQAVFQIEDLSDHQKNFTFIEAPPDSCVKNHIIVEHEIPELPVINPNRRVSEMQQHIVRKIEELIAKNQHNDDSEKQIINSSDSESCNQNECKSNSAEEEKKADPIEEPVSLKCLVANDEALQLMVLGALLKKAGFEVTTAINGQAAYEEVFKSLRPDQKPFDLVVLDLCMPVTDGYEACTMIRNLFGDRIKNGILPSDPVQKS